MDLIKQSYVELAANEFQIEGRKQSVSRIAVLTGMHRKDVSLYLAKSQSDEPQNNFHTRAAKVVSAWLTSSEFCDEQGRPRSLPIDGAEASFSALVMKHSGSMTVRSMLDEMIRVEAVRLNDRGLVSLLNEVYVPKHSDPQRLSYMGDASFDLLNTLSVNIFNPQENRLQLTTAFDNLPAECIPDFKVYCQKQSSKLLKDIEQWLSKRDRDSGPTKRDSGSGRVRAGLGLYYIENDIDDLITKQADVGHSKGDEAAYNE